MELVAEQRTFRYQELCVCVYTCLLVILSLCLCVVSSEGWGVESVVPLLFLPVCRIQVCGKETPVHYSCTHKPVCKAFPPLSTQPPPLLWVQGCYLQAQPTMTVKKGNRLSLGAISGLNSSCRTLAKGHFVLCQTGRILLISGLHVNCCHL